MQQTSELSDSEMKFRRKRAQIAMAGLQKLLGDDKGPTSVEETPTIALAISGGGYRAISTSCGAMEALMENNIFDTLMYCVGLSGSVWYMSATYSRKVFSDLDTLKKGHDLIRDLLREGLDTDLFMKSLIETLSLVHSFGAAWGDALLENEHQDIKLSSLREYVEEARVPFPIFSAAHVLNNYPANEFWEELEFTPFEATFASYRLLVPIEHVNSVWKNRVLSEAREEPKLHYVMGFCGSAFAILASSYFLNGHENVDRPSQTKGTTKRSSPKGERKASAWNGLTGLLPDTPTSPFSADISSRHKPISPAKDSVMSKEKFEATVWRKFLEEGLTEEGEDMTLDDTYSVYLQYMESEDRRWIEDVDTEMNEESPADRRSIEDVDTELIRESPAGSSESPHRVHRMKTTPQAIKIDLIGRNIACLERTGFLPSPIYKMPNAITKYMMNGQPVTDQNHGTMKRIGMNYFTDERKMLIVDSGLSCNVPAIHVARPQKKVDIILVVDCETKATDRNSKRFMETLKHLQDQMSDNNMKFPTIDVEKLKNDPAQEYYLFEDADDPECPIVIWFTLYNIRFRTLLHAPRSDEYPPDNHDGKRFNDFDVTPDSKEYATTNFKYSRRDVDRLRELMRYNIGNNVKVIKEKISQKVVHLRSKAS